MTPLSVLLTGPTGFIGNHVVRHLHEAGHQVTALDLPNGQWEGAAGEARNMTVLTEPSWDSVTRDVRSIAILTLLLAGLPRLDP